jgi:hypothetical protein
MFRVPCDPISFEGVSLSGEPMMRSFVIGSPFGTGHIIMGCKQLVHRIVEQEHSHTRLNTYQGGKPRLVRVLQYYTSTE